MPDWLFQPLRSEMWDRVGEGVWENSHLVLQTDLKEFWMPDSRFRGTLYMVDKYYTCVTCILKECIPPAGDENLLIYRSLPVSLDDFLYRQRFGSCCLNTRLKPQTPKLWYLEDSTPWHAQISMAPSSARLHHETYLCLLCPGSGTVHYCMCPGL